MRGIESLQNVGMQSGFDTEFLEILSGVVVFLTQSLITLLFAYLQSQHLLTILSGEEQRPVVRLHQRTLPTRGQGHVPNSRPL